MRILVTGLGGFVGLHLARHLLDLGDSVTGLHLGPCEEIAGVDVASVDILDLAGLREAVAGFRPDVILHLAGLSHVGRSWDRMADYFRVNVLGTENVLTAAAGRSVVLVSSAEVYGCVPEEEQPISEDRELDPRSPYALTKAAAERMVLAQNGIVVRSFNQVGPGQAEHFALPSFARQLARFAANGGEAVLKVGNLAARRDFVHVDDGARALRLVAEKGRGGEVYNIASGRAVSIGEALELLIGISGVAARHEQDESKFRPVDMPLLVGDASKLGRLGWCPQYDLEGALRELWDEAKRAARAGGSPA